VAVEDHAAWADDERRCGHMDRIGVLRERLVQPCDLAEEALDGRALACVHRCTRRDLDENLRKAGRHGGAR
jgi:hypothetical protein